MSYAKRLYDLSEDFRQMELETDSQLSRQVYFAEGVSRLTVSEIVVSDFPAFEFDSEVVPDKVLIMKFDDGGGIISYRKTEDRFVHTLNDEQGFTRKLKQLQIQI